MSLRDGAAQRAVEAIPCFSEEIAHLHLRRVQVSQSALAMMFFNTNHSAGRAGLSTINTTAATGVTNATNPQNSHARDSAW